MQPACETGTIAAPLSTGRVDALYGTVNITQAGGHTIVPTAIDEVTSAAMPMSCSLCEVTECEIDEMPEECAATTPIQCVVAGEEA